MANTLRLLLIVIASFFLLGSPCGSPSPATTLAGQEGCIEPADGVAWRAEVLRLVNVERTAQGLSELTWNQTLGDQANQYACEMIECGVVAHDNPCTGTELADRSAQFGYDYELIGENLASGYDSPAEVVPAWMGSPDHRANILHAEFTEVGVGLAAVAADGELYWVLEFGLPASASQERQCAIPGEADTWCAEVLARINQERVAAGVAPLTWNASLAQQAQQYAGEMCTCGFVAHTSPCTGSTLRERSEAAGYVGATLGECLGGGPSDAAEVVTKWLANASYRRDILNAIFQDAGVGVCSGGELGMYWVLDLGQPRQGG